MRIPDFPRTQSLRPNDIMLVDGSDGTRGIQVSDLVTPEMHRMIFRGKNLGTSVTAAQQSAIKDGTFNDIFVGDYWAIGGFIWRIVDINYWLNRGDVPFIDNHIVIMPDVPLYDAVMNDTMTTTGAYLGSRMYATNLAQAKTIINNAFGPTIKSHRQYFTNAVGNGAAIGAAWVDSTVDLPNEINIYGSYIYTPSNDGLAIPIRGTIDTQQFALFAIKPLFSSGTTRGIKSLRDPISGGHFAATNNVGAATFLTASIAGGVRPCFAIG